jgi:hypothetical protein
VPVSVGSNAAFYLVAEQDKRHHASTKGPRSEAIVEIDALGCPKISASLCHHHTLENVEQLCLNTYELPPYTIVCRHETYPFIRQKRSKNEVLKILNLLVKL